MRKEKWMISIIRESTSMQYFSKLLIQKTWMRTLLRTFEHCVAGVASCTLSIIYVDNEKIKTLNHTYRAHSRVTDVLSFAYGEPPKIEEGEIYICLPQVLKQHTRFRTTPIKEVERLFFHGLLHIYGYDHKKKSERAVMASLERCLMKHSRTATL